MTTKYYVGDMMYYIHDDNHTPSTREIQFFRISHVTKRVLEVTSIGTLADDGGPQTSTELYNAYTRTYDVNFVPDISKYRAKGFVKKNQVWLPEKGCKRSFIRDSSGLAMPTRDKDQVGLWNEEPIKVPYNKVRWY